MKITKAFALVMAACVILPSAASAKYKVRTISIDGYCDVFTVWEFGRKWVTLTNDPSSCETANGVGQMTRNKYFGTAASAGVTLNGDGSTAQIFGNPVKIQDPSVLLAPGSNQALIEGDTA